MKNKRLKSLKKFEEFKRKHNIVEHATYMELLKERVESDPDYKQYKGSLKFKPMMIDLMI